MKNWKQLQRKSLSLEEVRRMGREIREKEGEEGVLAFLSHLASLGEKQAVFSLCFAGEENYHAWVYSFLKEQRESILKSKELWRAVLEALFQLKHRQSSKEILKLLEESPLEEGKFALELSLSSESLFPKVYQLFAERDRKKAKEWALCALQSHPRKARKILTRLLKSEEEPLLDLAFALMLQIPPTKKWISPMIKLLPHLPSSLVPSYLKVVISLPEASDTYDLVRAIAKKVEEQPDSPWASSWEVFLEAPENLVSSFVKYFEFRRNLPKKVLVSFIEFLISYAEKDEDYISFVCSEFSFREDLPPSLREKTEKWLLSRPPARVVPSCVFCIFSCPNQRAIHLLEQVLLRHPSFDVEAEIREYENQGEDYFSLLRSLFTLSRSSRLQKIASRNFLLAKFPKLSDFGVLLSFDSLSMPCFEREKEVQTILKLLRRRGNRSFILLGPSGAGKTAIIHELARRLLKEGEKYPFDAILEVTTGGILSGTKYLGEWETKLDNLIQALREYKRVLLYVTDVNNLVCAGRSSSSRLNFLSMLAPYMERGEVVVIGESTPIPYGQGIGSEYSAKKLFQVIQVEEMDVDTTERALKKTVEFLKEKAVQEWNAELILPLSVLHRVMEMGTYFFPGIARPGNVIQLLLQVVERKREQLGEEKEFARLVVEPDDVVRTLSDTMEIPEKLINDRIPLDLEEVRRFFATRVLGQEQAIDSLVSLIAMIKAGLTNPERPHGVLFFVGPTGVGKTEIARVLAEYLTGDPNRLIRIDMSAFKDYDSFERFIGSQYHLSPQGDLMAPQLVQKIRTHPFSVVLLDEIEKAHPNVWDLFLQVFDYGKLVDVRAEEIDFRQTVIIMTSNLGYEESLEDRVGFEGGSWVLNEEDIKREMARTFRPEFINRIDKIVIFRPLDRDTMVKITNREIGKILSRSGILRRNLSVRIEPEVVDLLVEKGFSPRFGARQLKRAVEELLLRPLAEAIVQKNPSHGSHLKVRCEGETIRVEIQEDRATSRKMRLIQEVRRKSKGTTRFVKLEDLEQWKEELKKEISQLEETFDREKRVLRKQELLQKTQAVDFWDHPLRAQEILEEIHYLERLLFSMGEIEKHFQEFVELLQKVRENGDRALLQQAAMRFFELQKEVELASFEAQCTSQKSRADVFLWLESSSQEAFSFVYQFFQKWAEKNTFSLLPLWHSEANGYTKGLVFLQGVCLYGLLKSEEGKHRVVQKGEEQLVNLYVFPRLRGASLSNCQVKVCPLSCKSAFYPDWEVLLELSWQGGQIQGFARADEEEKVSRLLKDFAAFWGKSSFSKTLPLVRTYYLDPPAPYLFDHLLERSFPYLGEAEQGDVNEIFLKRAKKYAHSRRG